MVRRKRLLLYLLLLVADEHPPETFRGRTSVRHTSSVSRPLGPSHGKRGTGGDSPCWAPVSLCARPGVEPSHSMGLPGRILKTVVVSLSSLYVPQVLLKS